MTELDKFKRRTIRSVARLLRQKKPPDELWPEMKKETGADCRVLWERMRALCIKKLSRMLGANDRSDFLPAIARLSLTDWLLVDLVLVHENIDVIAQDKQDSKAEQKPLVELFNLVQRFDVEGREGEPLAEAWAAATVFYNRQGRQCSPMLLQRRWYQLKKLTRGRFYKFWHSYRGNTRLLAEAKGTMPNRLQMAVAKRYPAVITEEFPEWEELIVKRLVIMPEEFEAKMRMTNLPKPCNSNDPDLVVVEPNIETIDLGVDSDPEESKEDQIEDTTNSEKSNDATNVSETIDEQSTKQHEMVGVKIKTEPVEQDGLSNVQVVATTHVTEVEIPDIDSPEREVESISTTVNKETHIQENFVASSPERDGDDLNLVENNPECDDVNLVLNSPECDDVNLVQNSPECDDNVTLAENSPEFDDNIELAENNLESDDDINLAENSPQDEDDVHLVEDNPDDEDDAIEIPTIIPSVNVNESLIKTVENEQAKERAPEINSVLSNSINIDDEIRTKADEFCNKVPKELPVKSNESNLVDDLIKDKMDIFLNTLKVDEIEKKPDIKSINLSEQGKSTAIDLMADLNFIDDGIEFVDDGVEFVEDNDVPKTDTVTETSSQHSSDTDSESNNKFDLKLLMDPVVYTTKLDHMNIFRNKDIFHVRNEFDILNVVKESKPVSKRSFSIKQEDREIKIKTETEISFDAGLNDDLFTTEETSEEEEDILEDVTVSPNSNMLKKPRNRTYNPINLCKNPDFNTKLKRLTIGFLSSTRNRQLLNACIPMTIDVSKSFESKLVDGTLYLKCSGTNINSVEEPEVDNHSSSIVPSAMPVQSLIDNSKTDIHDLIRTRPTTAIVNPDISERKKIISLPDIDKVRKINQQLLTAQVPPLRVYSGDSYRPPTAQPTIVSVHSEVKELKAPESLDSQISPVSETRPLSPVIVSTVVKIESEAKPSHQLSTEEITAVHNVVQEIESPQSPSQQIPPTLSAASPIPSIVKVESQANVEPTETLPPAKAKLMKIINQAKLLTQEALTKIDIGTASSSNDIPKKTIVKKAIPKPNESKKHLPNRVPISWLVPKPVQRPEAIDDFLITGDTLNKMLHLIGSENNEKDCTCCSGKKKGKKKCEKKDKRKKSEDSNSSNNDSKNEKEASKKTSLQDAAPKPKPLARGRVVRYCCWARQKLCNRKRIMKHTCQPNECVCCCRDELAMVLEQIKTVHPPAPIVVSDDEDLSLKKACESIENVVQQAREAPKVTYRLVENSPPLPKIKVKATKLVVMRSISTSTATDFQREGTSGVVSENQIMNHDLANQVIELPTVDVPTGEISKIPSIHVLANQVSGFPNIHVSVNNTPGLQSVPEPAKQTQERERDNVPSLFPIKGPSPKLKRISPLKASAHLQPVPCSCQRPAVSQGSERNIVIDARCPSHPTPIAAKRDNKVLYMHSKSIAKNPTECPIFLGKNKILLTTVKFPRTNEPTMPECEVFQPPKIIPTLPVPNGVQLVLLPSGNVTYTLDPDVTLSEAQMATLPTIIAAVQEQLNTSPGSEITPVNENNNPNIASESTSDVQAIVDTTPTEVPINTDTLNLNTTEGLESDNHSPQKVTDNLEVAISASTNIDALKTSDITENLITPKEVDDIASVASGTDLVPPSEETVKKVANENESNEETPSVPNTQSLNDTQTVVESEIQTEKQSLDHQNTQEESEATNQFNDNEAANNRKSLLSDLMEMSGISAEDTKVVEPPVVEQSSTEEIYTDNVRVTADETKNLPELSPVTSFAELKYACEQNGKFFKLDFETGVIVPINVCIKKNIKQKAPQVTKAVIDLTEEDESLNNKTPAKSSEVLPTAPTSPQSLLKRPVQYVYRGQTVNVTEPVKPIKLFKAVRPTLLKRPKKVETQSFVRSKRARLENRRKQDLSKVEAKIDLVDSDAPMEEEYLVDSSDDDSLTQEIQPVTVETPEESDYSSDDEPLAKKSKRIRGNLVENENGDSHVENDTQPAVNDAVKVIPDPKPTEDVDDVPKDSAVDMECEQFSPDGDNEELKNDFQPVLRFMSDSSDNEDEEEDCILGV